MKKAILIVLTAFILTGCGLGRNIKNNTESVKTSETRKETKRDSSSVVEKTQPTENGIEFDLDALNKMVGDFKQSISSGNGSESTIEKKDGKLIVTNKTAGTENKETKVDNSETEFRYDSEYVLSETKKIIKRMPWQFWMIAVIALLIFFRKFIFQILTAFFPALGATRLVSLFIGNNQKD